MSNRKHRSQPQLTEPGSPPPSIFIDTYRYNIANGVVTIEGGRGGAWHVGMSMGIELAIDMHQKLGVSIANMIRPTPPATPDPVENADLQPKPEEPKP